MTRKGFFAVAILCVTLATVTAQRVNLLYQDYPNLERAPETEEEVKFHGQWPPYRPEKPRSPPKLDFSQNFIETPGLVVERDFYDPLMEVSGFRDDGQMPNPLEESPNSPGNPFDSQITDPMPIFMDNFAPDYPIEPLGEDYRPFPDVFPVYKPPNHPRMVKHHKRPSHRTHETFSWVIGTTPTTPRPKKKYSHLKKHWHSILKKSKTSKSPLKVKSYKKRLEEKKRSLEKVPEVLLLSDSSSSPPFKSTQKKNGHKNGAVPEMTTHRSSDLSMRASTTMSSVKGPQEDVCHAKDKDKSRASSSLRNSIVNSLVYILNF